MNSPEDQPKMHFRGTQNPQVLHDLLMEGSVTPTEFVLLAVIDSFTKCTDEGCWASKGYLGKVIGVKTLRHVQMMISKLIKLGLLKDVGSTQIHGRERRILVTVWSHVNISPDAFKSRGQMLLKAPNVLSSLRSDNTLSHVASNVGNPEGKTNMPLVDISPLSPKQPCANNDHIDQAKTLKSSLTKKHVGITTKFSAKSWAKEFALLETAVGAHRVVPVLTWYCNNIRGQYVPLAFSAKSFRQKFDAIEQAMVRYQRDHPNIEISEEAKKIGETMKGWKWPKGGDYQTLLAAIQITMDTYRKFLTAVKKLSSQPTKEKVPGKKNRYRLIKGSQCVSVASPVFDRLDFADTFTRNWFRKLHETASHFGKEWNGSILKGAFTDFGHRKFQEYVEAILGSYTHDISIESFMRAVENAG